MTIQGAINELINLLNADDIPIYYKGGIKKVIETIQMEIAEQTEPKVAMPKRCKGCDSASKIIEAYSRGFEDGAEAVKAMPQTFTADGIVFAKMDEAEQTEPQIFICPIQDDYEALIEDEPQTDTEIAKAIVHEMIDNSVIAEDAYPGLRQRMHEAVERLDEYYPSEDERGRR